MTSDGLDTTSGPSHVASGSPNHSSSSSAVPGLDSRLTGEPGACMSADPVCLGPARSCRIRFLLDTICLELGGADHESPPVLWWPAYTAVGKPSASSVLTCNRTPEAPALLSATAARLRAGGGGGCGGCCWRARGLSFPIVCAILIAAPSWALRVHRFICRSVSRSPGADPAGPAIRIMAAGRPAASGRSRAPTAGHAKFARHSL
jgi:hypothetical protein